MILDGRNMTTRGDLHDVLTEKFDLPEHYGRNLDALNDCLSSLNKREEISIVHAGKMREALGGYAEKFIEVLEENGFVVSCIDGDTDTNHNRYESEKKEIQEEMKMSNIPTPHINAPEGAFAPTVLMPGDPLRAKYIAENYLEDAVLVNNVRGVQGYTGTYKGKRVSVMASGMGIPSIGIYSYELFNFYGVENIIRVGSAGAMTDKLKLRDIVAGMSAYTNSAYGRQFGFEGTLAPCCSYDLLRKAVAAGEKLGQHVVPGPVYSSDNFYAQGTGFSSEPLMKLGVLCVEMETYALYLNAAAAGKNALSLLTISDSLVTGEALPAEDRQNTFTKMMEIALEIA